MLPLIGKFNSPFALSFYRRVSDQDGNAFLFSGKKENAPPFFLLFFLSNSTVEMLIPP